MSNDLTIIYRDLSELIPYDRNPRNNEAAVGPVAESIRQFGFKCPIIIDGNDVIVAGHTRLLAAKKLGLDKVPCVVADDLTEEQIKAFRLADNKVSELAEWNADLLGEELKEITDIDMSEFGFELSEFNFGEDSGNDSQPVDSEQNEWDDIEKMESHYGVPYQGNKSRIADIIISVLPEGKRLVDLFGGGGAITHCAMLSGKWESYLYNDLNPMITGLFMDAVNGKYHDERRVITREEFNELKDSDAYVKYLWSFGNNGTGYLWGSDIEELKVNACHSLMDESLNDRRMAYVHFAKMIKERLTPEQIRLESIERLQSLEHLEALQRLEVTNIDYHDYVYADGDIVYCDVPYEQLGKKKCDDYGVDFDSLAFYEWVKSQPYQIFFSSYEISDDSFYKLKIKSVMSLIGATTNSQKVNEYLYSNKPIIYNKVD